MRTRSAKSGRKTSSADVLAEMRRCLILVEGQTEEQFVKRVLADHLQPRGIYVTPTIVNTKRVKDGPNFKGGLCSYAQVKRDLRSLLQDSSVACITTLIDYYGLPSDFPGMSTRPRGSPHDRVQHVEEAFADDIGDRRLLPHAALHEFESLVFSDLEACAWVFSEGADLEPLRNARASVSSPEEINEGPRTAPSKRILACDPAFQKTLHGPMAVEAIGLQKLREECPHFHRWVTRLERC